MIFETEVWCHTATEREREMGIPDGDQWLPIAIDWDKVLAVKLAGENDFYGADKASVYVSDQHFIINCSYKRAIEEWKATKLRVNRL